MQRHKALEGSPSLIHGLSGEQADASEDGTLNKIGNGSRRKKLRVLTSKTKVKTKRLFRVEDEGSTSESAESNDHGVMQSLEHDPAFSHDKLHKQKRRKDGGTAYKPLNALESIATAVVHPVDAIKSKATKSTAGQLSKVDRPYISRRDDLDFLEAHDNLNHAESSRSSKQGMSDSEGDTATSAYREKIKEMQKHRESLRAAMTTSRYVRRVRVVPKRHMVFPDSDFFMKKDCDGDHFDWMSWLGYVSLHTFQESRRIATDFHAEFDILYSGLLHTIHR